MLTQFLIVLLILALNTPALTAVGLFDSASIKPKSTSIDYEYVNNVLNNAMALSTYRQTPRVANPNAIFYLTSSAKNVHVYSNEKVISTAILHSNLAVRCLVLAYHGRRRRPHLAYTISRAITNNYIEIETLYKATVANRSIYFNHSHRLFQWWRAGPAGFSESTNSGHDFGIQLTAIAFFAHSAFLSISLLAIYHSTTWISFLEGTALVLLRWALYPLFPLATLCAVSLPFQSAIRFDCTNRYGDPLISHQPEVYAYEAAALHTLVGGPKQEAYSNE